MVKLFPRREALEHLWVIKLKLVKAFQLIFLLVVAVVTHLRVQVQVQVQVQARFLLAAR
jgi:hypothetical protein